MKVSLFEISYKKNNFITIFNFIWMYLYAFKSLLCAMKLRESINVQLI